MNGHAPIVIEYAAWHDDARKDRAAGLSTVKIAQKYGVSRGRISQIVAPLWQAYNVLWRIRKDNPNATIESIAPFLKSGAYTFRPISRVSPAEFDKIRSAAKEPPPKVEKPVEVTPMSQMREFEAVKDFRDGKHVTGAKIACYKCNATETYFHNGRSVNPACLPKEFERRGWLVGKNKNTDMCPSCLATLRGRKPKQEDISVAPVKIIPNDLKTSTTMIPPSAKGIHTVVQPPKGIEAIGVSLAPALKEVPMPTVTPAVVQVEEKKEPEERAMTKADDRIIMAKLEEVYIDENTGYRDDWDDAKVATDLGIPTGWVAFVRDRSFGPELNASMRQKNMDAIIAKGQEVERIIVLADKKLEQLQHLDNKVTDISNQVDAAIERFDELRKSLETEDRRIEGVITQFTEAVRGFKEMYEKIKP